MQVAKELFFILFASAAIVSGSQPSQQTKSTWEDAVTAGNRAYGAGNLKEAESYFRKALKEAESANPEDERVATSAANLAMVRKAQGKLGDAEKLLKRALKILEKRLGSDHLDVATVHEHLGYLYFDLFLGASGHDRLALDFGSTILTIESSADLAGILFSAGAGQTPAGMIAQSHQANSDRESARNQAEDHLKRALVIREKNLGLENQAYVPLLISLGELCLLDGRYANAEAFLRRSLSLAGKGGTDDLVFVKVQTALASALRRQGKFSEAQTSLSGALAILEKKVGPEHTVLIPFLRAYAGLLRDSGKSEEAKQYEARAESLGKKR